MSRRPTIADVALRAGVSVATVDRALNGRHHVREETLRRVYDASCSLGFHAAGILKKRLQEDLPCYSLGLLVLGTDACFILRIVGSAFSTDRGQLPRYPRVGQGRVP